MSSPFQKWNGDTYVGDRMATLMIYVSKKTGFKNKFLSAYIHFSWTPQLEAAQLFHMLVLVPLQRRELQCSGTTYSGMVRRMCRVRMEGVLFFMGSNGVGLFALNIKWSALAKKNHFTVSNKWIREGAQLWKRPCDLKPDSTRAMEAPSWITAHKNEPLFLFCSLWAFQTAQHEI